MFRSLGIVPKILISGFIVFGFATTSLQPVLAQQAPRCNKDTEQELSVGIPDPNDPTGQRLIYCVPRNSPNLQTNPIIGYLRAVIQFMAVGIGIALVGGLVVGGMLYMTARANAQQVQKGEEVIRNVIIGIALYVFTFSIVNFLIPGGILN